MPARRRRPAPQGSEIGHRRSRVAIALALAAALALTGAAVSSASTGTVFYDSFGNVGAGNKNGLSQWNVAPRIG